MLCRQVGADVVATDEFLSTHISRESADGDQEPKISLDDMGVPGLFTLILLVSCFKTAAPLTGCSSVSGRSYCGLHSRTLGYKNIDQRTSYHCGQNGDVALTNRCPDGCISGDSSAKCMEGTSGETDVQSGMRKFQQQLPLTPERLLVILAVVQNCFTIAKTVAIWARLALVFVLARIRLALAFVSNLWQRKKQFETIAAPVAIVDAIAIADAIDIVPELPKRKSWWKKNKLVIEMTRCWKK